MPSSTRGSVYRAVRFSVPVAFSVLTGRAGHPRLRDDVGIVPYAGGRDALGLPGRLRTQGITGSGHEATPYNTESVSPRVGVDALIDP